MMENKLRELLLPVLDKDSVDEIGPDDSLVNDLDADSIDFVEIIYLIEKNFGVVLKTNQIIVAGTNPEDLFEEERLTEKGAEIIARNLDDQKGRYKKGMTRIELFQTLTVRDLAKVIEIKMAEKN
ncbi:MAG: acyl carrier protein [Candidatus Rifleibacteriota bacterium]